MDPAATFDTDAARRLCRGWAPRRVGTRRSAGWIPAGWCWVGIPWVVIAGVLGLGPLAASELEDIEARADTLRRAASPSYREALAAWETVAAHARKLEDTATLLRSEEARGGLFVLLEDPAGLERLRKSGSRQAVDPAKLGIDAPGLRAFSSPYGLAQGGSSGTAPSDGALEKVQRFLAQATGKTKTLPGAEARDVLLLLQLEALLFKLKGDGPMRQAEGLLQQALATLSGARAGNDVERARLEAARFRLLFRLRRFDEARQVLKSNPSVLKLLPVPERIRHLRLVRDLASLEGDRVQVLAALNDLMALGDKAEQAAQFGTRFRRFLPRSPVDLAETAQTLLGALAAYRLGDWERGLVAYLVGVASMELGEYGLAEEVLRTHAAPANQDPWLAASFAARLGFVRGELGSHEAALHALERAGLLAQEMGGVEDFQARIALNEARSLLSLGQLDAAREKALWVLSSPGLQEDNVGRDLRVRARILMGNVLYEKARESPALLADARGAFETARRELQAARESGAPLESDAELEIVVGINLGNVLRQVGMRSTGAEAEDRRKDATAAQDRAMRAAHAAGLYGLAAVASANLGELYLESGNLDSAKSFAEWALARAVERGLVETEWRCHWYLGRVADRQGLEELADSEYSKAESIVDTYRSSILDAERKLGFLTDKMDLYRDLVRRNLSKGRYGRALAAAERAKARGLLDSLGWRFLTLADSRYTELYRQFVGLVSRVEKARSGPASQVFGVPQVETDYQEIQSKLSDLRARIERTYPEGHLLRALVMGKALDSAEILSALPKASTLVEYFSLGTSYVALVASGDRVQAVSLDVAPSDLSSWVTSYVLKGAEDRAVAERLYGWLVKPLEGLLSTRRVVVVPHGVLHELPFETLWNGREYALTRFEFVYLPSASMLRYLQAKPDGGDGELRLLAIVDPDTDYDGDGSPDMPPLPYARDEVDGVASAFPQKEVLSGSDALKSQCEKEIPKADVIHYAGHGEFYPTRPWDSSLFLAAERAGRSEADGRLRASEVYGFDLRRSRLVALSGCETGRSRILPGDDTISIATAFLHTGASSLLVSLWKVEDRATAALMKSFYRKWLREGKDRATALRESKLELLAGSFPRPRQWAAFVLIGEP